MKPVLSTCLGVGSSLLFSQLSIRKKTTKANCFDENDILFHKDNLTLDSIIGSIVTSDRFILPFSSSLSRSSSSFLVVYDTQRRNPLFTIERLSSQDFAKQIPIKGVSEDDLEQDIVTKSNNRPMFFVESQIPFKASQVHPKNYTDSKYDRGHMVAAADFLHETALYKQTFSMANISPQASFLNRGFWSRLEAWIRYYLLRYVLEEVLIVTGPVFAPVFVNNQWIYLHRTIGDFPNLITVPSHFFKIIIGRQKGEKTMVIAAFLVPNNNTVSKKDPVESYLVKLEQLESILGWTLLPTTIVETPKSRLDLAVPEYRDLSILLNPKLPSNTLSIDQITHPDQPLLPSRAHTIDSEKRIVVSSSHNKKNKESICHLCQLTAVDCRKPMFPPRQPK